MNIVLVMPTWTEDLGIFAKVAQRRNSQPPQGILYIAAVAEKRGHHVRVIDAEVEGYGVNALAAEILRGSYDMVGITATSPIFHKAVGLAKELKAKGYAHTILIGGEHLNIFKKQALFDCFDYGFFGESDRTFDHFLSIIERGSKDFSAMRGFVYRENGQVIQTPPAEKIKDLDELDFPSMHLLNHDKYWMSFVNFKKRRYIPILATRGCPFKCSFCSEPLTNPIVRFRSPKNIVDEMEKWVKELGITHFFFMDSNLTLRRSQIEGVCDEIKKRNLKITFEGWTRANLIDADIMKRLKETGLLRLSFGLESGNAQILKTIRKEVSHEEMIKAFQLIEEVGVEPACSLMIGLPGETRETVEETINFINSIPQILYTNFSIANPYPGTELFEWATAGDKGIKLLINDFSEYRRYDYSPISVNGLSPEELVQLQKWGLIRMHLSPKRMLAAMKMIGLVSIIPVLAKFAIVEILKLITTPFSPKRKNQLA